MKTLILALVLFIAGVTQAQEIFNSPNQVIYGDTAYTGAGNVQTGTVATPSYLRPYDMDILGFSYPVMDSSSQFTVVFGVYPSDAISSVQVYPDSVVTFTFAVDSSAAGKVFIDTKYTEIFNYFSIAIPDTVFDNKTFNWILKPRID